MTDENPKSPWAWPGIVDKMKELLTRGETSSKVAKALNKDFPTRLTRNAVIGKAHRLKIIRPATAPKVRGEALRQANNVAARKQAQKPKPKPKAKSFVPEPRPPRQIPADKIWLDVEGSKPFLERRHCECAWPVGDKRVCSAPIKKGSYCKAHARVAYVATSSPRDLERGLRRHL